MALMHRGLFRENLISIFNQFQSEYTTLNNLFAHCLNEAYRTSLRPNKDVCACCSLLNLRNPY